jgi:hypothetical protein
VGESKNKANSALLKLELGLNLVKIELSTHKIIFYTDNKKEFLENKQLCSKGGGGGMENSI